MSHAADDFLNSFRLYIYPIDFVFLCSKACLDEGCIFLVWFASKACLTFVMHNEQIIAG